MAYLRHVELMPGTSLFHAPWVVFSSAQRNNRFASFFKGNTFIFMRSDVRVKVHCKSPRDLQCTPRHGTATQAMPLLAAGEICPLTYPKTPLVSIMF